MTHPTLTEYLSAQKRTPLKGPIAIVLMEDAVEVNSTLRHHLASGFKTILALGDANINLAADISEDVTQITYDMHVDQAMPDAVNAVTAAAAGEWIYYCYNGEYLFFPFCEDRKVGEMAAFMAEERRSHVLTYVVDLYASDLTQHPDAVSLDDAHLDRSGYYAQARASSAGDIKERELDFYGGLRWRFEEHVPFTKRRIDRIGLFRSKPGLKITEDHRLSEDEMNTYSCPWHHNLTGCIASFRTAKALKRNPGSSYAIETFKWRNSVKFDWHSQQLMDLGLMEPGQWF